jgi:hypothetical protein
MPTLQHPQWYAIQTRSRYEKVVRDKLINAAIECLLPLCTRMSDWKDRKKRIEWPLFVGYCFGRFALEQRRQVKLRACYTLSEPLMSLNLFQRPTSPPSSDSCTLAAAIALTPTMSKKEGW